MKFLEGSQAPLCGAFALGNGETLFRIWAPDAPPGMCLKVEGHAPLPIVADAKGYAEHRVADCPPGTRYYYVLADGSTMPDPASRLQDGDVQGASMVVDPAAYPWRHPDWQPRPWPQSILYEVHVGLAGGFDGLRQRLPDLAALGINLLELMPIAAFSGTRNWGYDGVLPFAPNAAYGSPDALKQLIDEAHGLGMGVMLDVVYNHFGPEGNHLPRYAARFFRDDIHTPWGAAIDFAQPAVRQHFEDSAIHWLDEFRFDGLRLDAIHAIHDDAWLCALPDRLRARLPGRRVHLITEDDNNRAHLLRAGFDAQWDDDLHHVLHHFLTGERHGYYGDYCEDPAAILARCLAQGWHYQGQASTHQGRARGEPTTGLPPSAFVFFLQNHDQIGNRPLGERLSVLTLSPERLRAAVALQVLSPMVPLLFMGEELGAQTPFHYFTSHHDPRLTQAVRAGRAREFPGSPDMRAHELPDPDAPATFEASRPWAERDPAWERYYRQLLTLRICHLSRRLQGARSEGARVLGTHAVRAVWRLADGAHLIHYINLGDRPCPIPPEHRSTIDSSRSLRFESLPGALAQATQGVLPGDCALCLINEAHDA